MARKTNWHVFGHELKAAEGGTSQATSDVVMIDTPTVCVFEPRNDAARKWLSDNVEDESIWIWGGVACEPRFAEGLIEAIRDAGFQIHGEHGS